MGREGMGLVCGGQGLWESRTHHSKHQYVSEREYSLAEALKQH